MRLENWPPAHIPEPRRDWPFGNSLAHCGDGPIRVDREGKLWGECGDCGQAPVLIRLHQCPSTVDSRPVCPPGGSGGPVVPAPRSGDDRAHTAERAAP